MIKKLKEIFMRTFISMRMGEGNFIDRINKIVQEEKKELKGGVENVQEEEKEN